MSSLRRLAKDHAILRASLPPNYLFPPTDDNDALPDDLTQLRIHLTGSDGTPYSSGLWLLHLKIPPDYPKSPPKATFKTRIFHPNVEESTGAVCLETLKRDWDPKLTLKDILITISCLLIQPNPDSALNEKAGVLVREDYDGFVRQARLMTKIHAPIPVSLDKAVTAARRRGEDDGSDSVKGPVQKPQNRSVSLQKSADRVPEPVAFGRTGSSDSIDSAKENNPNVRDGDTTNRVESPKSHVLGKRPLMEKPVMSEADDSTVLDPNQVLSRTESGEPPRKSPRHTFHSQANGREPKAQSVGEGSGQTILVKPQETVSSLPTVSSSLDSIYRSKPLNKYRTYARIGIKRL